MKKNLKHRIIGKGKKTRISLSQTGKGARTSTKPKNRKENKK